MPITPDSEIAMPSTLALPEILDLKAAAPLAGEFLTLRGRSSVSTLPGSSGWGDNVCKSFSPPP